MGHDGTGFMSWVMGGMGLFFLLILVLAIAALLKYLFGKGNER